MMMDVRPTPRDDDDRARWEIGELIVQLLEGEWDRAAERALERFFHPDVLERLTSADMSRNPLKSFYSQINLLFDEDPYVAAGSQADFPELVTPYLWPMRQQAQLYTLAANEAYMRLDWSPGRGLVYRPIPHSEIGRTIADRDYPDRPVYLEQLVKRDRGGEALWTWETWDVRDPAKPVFRIEARDRSYEANIIEDVTEEFAGSKDYPYWDTAGRPILPHVLLHKQVSNSLYSPRRGIELVRGTLTVAVLHTFLLYGIRDCSNPQRVAIDMQSPPGLVPRKGGPTMVPMDPSSILMLQSKGEKNGSVTTLSPAMSPKEMYDTISRYARDLAIDAGMSPADVRMESNVEISGYAITVGRDGQRKAVRRQIPAARMGDRLILATGARLSNAYGGTRYPEDPKAWSVGYRELGKSAEELGQELDQIDRLMERGLASRVDAMLRIYPEMTEEQATAKVVDIARTNQLLNDLQTPDPGQEMTDGR